MTSPARDIVPGSLFQGKYRVEHVLGEGGMGIVVAATHLTLGQKVAIKFLRGTGAMKSEVIERFVREARAAARIQGRHVAKVIDVGADERGLPYMVMEYLDGEDLAQRLQTVGILSVPEACRWVIQACEAIAEAHAAGIVHRDLKPSNLFLARQPSGELIVKVLDFGISKDLSAAPAESLTRTTAVMGTAFYMSPEQLQSAKHVDRRTDIWCLGVILYELLAGRVPFDAETLPEVIGLILTNRPPPIEQLRPEVPPALAGAVRRAMTTSLRERYQTVADLAADLAPFVGTPDAFQAASRARAILGDAPPADPVTGEFANHSGAFYQTSPPATFTRTSPPGAPASSVRTLLIGAVSALVAVGLLGGVAFAVRSRMSATGDLPPVSSSAAASTAPPASPPSAVPEGRATASVDARIPASAAPSASAAAPTPASATVRPSSTKRPTTGGLNSHDNLKN
jgi:serine/threonine protein kinase